MMRLGLMSVTALAGILLAMASAGDAPVRAGQAMDAPPLTGKLTEMFSRGQSGNSAAPVRLAQATTVATDAAPAEPAQPAPPAAAPKMPGPPLHRSPEYAHRDAQPQAGATATAADSADLPGNVLFVDANSLNMRSGPSTSDSVIGKLSRGDAVEPLGPIDSGWVEIKVIASGKRGFTSAKFLTDAR